MDICDGKQCGMGKHIGGRGYVCPHNNIAVKYPNLALQWVYERNIYKPEDITPGSAKMIWWKCPINPCGCHIWQSSVYNRVKGHGCPYCSNQKPCIHTCLQTLFPDIAAEFDLERNTVGPTEILPNSHNKYWWRCKHASCNCHIWQASASNRVSNQSKCPFCCNRQLCQHNTLYYLYPNIASEWDYEQNEGLFPWQIPPQYQIKCSWTCKDNPSHKWKTTPGHRVGSNSNCPYCFGARTYSNKQIKWIQDLEHEFNIRIQHALSPEGEFSITGIGKVDGYCKETNTVYEYHGDYFHGNPDIYDQNSFNEKVGKMFGELYKKTLERDNKIRALGYNLVVEWETPRKDNINNTTILTIDSQYFRVIYNE